jgi:hypothetical protein
MKTKIFIGVLLVSIIILLSSFPLISADQDNIIINQNLKDIKDNITNRIDKLPDIFWYPGFFITLLLAPFIIIYLIIAIILDIGNP